MDLADQKAKGSAALYTLEREFQKHSMNLWDVFPRDFVLSEIRFCIKKGTGPTRCHCGKNILKDSRNDRRYCGATCRGSDPEYRNRISTVKTEQYSDPAWKAATEAKKVATTMENHGVAYPMQNMDSHLKQQKSCFKRSKDGLQGYEPHVWSMLLPTYPDLMKGTDFLAQSGTSIVWMGDDGKKHKSYPDFYVPHIRSFIEVKSTYTYSIGEGKLKKCAERLSEMGYGYIVAISSPGKQLDLKIHNLNHIDEYVDYGYLDIGISLDSDGSSTSPLPNMAQIISTSKRALERGLPHIQINEQQLQVVGDYGDLMALAAGDMLMASVSISSCYGMPAVVLNSITVSSEYDIYVITSQFIESLGNVFVTVISGKNATTGMAPVWNALAGHRRTLVIDDEYCNICDFSGSLESQHCRYAILPPEDSIPFETFARIALTHKVTT